MCFTGATGIILAISNLQPNLYVPRQHQSDVPVSMEQSMPPMAHYDCEATTEAGNVRVTVAGATIAKLPVTAVPYVSGGVAASIATTE